ncbi:MAG: carboxypeptidase-like regulatory domain-containing protein [Armatimonadota bacterium]|nr:carboxypeptidase-like regulatory domain-containing protein [Armatimonadota bacterium]MCX7776843.1 carboxypeptidase-like regulatory domain-containing protein [Armatimonadota bacterium]MDW8024471.1 carboxypeptidase-like regulatory domain-containing protein [Armatimonadota bacterium]
MKFINDLQRWRIASLLFPVVVSAIVFHGCGGGGKNGISNQPSPTRGVTVFVQDAFTQQPIANASVRIGTQNLTTNNQGTVNSSIQPGAYQLQVSKSGYATVSTNIACFDGIRFSVYLTPNLPPVTNQNFQQRSEQVFAAAENLRNSIAAFVSADESTNQDVTLQFVTASNAFIAALNSVSNYSPPRDRNSMRGRLEFISSLLGLTKISQGTEDILRIRNRLLAGEDVPEVNAWLAQNPYQGARSLSELREMYPGPSIVPVLHRLLIVYERQNPNSGFNKAIDGAKDIWLAQFPDLLEGPKNLLSWAIDKVWSGAGKLVVRTVNYASLVLQNREQIAWLWDKIQSKLILVKVKNEQQITLPQTTYEVVISNGAAHLPTVFSDYQLGAEVQTLTITPTPISAPPSGAKVYLGTFVATETQSNNLGTWQHSVNLTLQLVLPDDPNQMPTLKVNGTYRAVRTALAPGVTLYEPSEGSYSFNAEGNPKVGVIQAWDNQLAVGFVQITQEITATTNTISLEVGSMWRFGSSGILTIVQTVTFQRQ